MRINVYAEEMTNRAEIVEKVIGGVTFTGIRFYLELPVTTRYGIQHKGPFIHRSRDAEPPHDDSSAITFWGTKDLRVTLEKAIDILNTYYAKR